MQKETKLVEVVALWEAEKDGRKYHRGTLKLGNASLRCFLFRNKHHKDGDERPALQLVVEVPVQESQKERT